MRSGGFGIIIIFAVITYAALSLKLVKIKLESSIPPGVLYPILMLLFLGLVIAYTFTISAYSDHRKWDNSMPWVGSGLGLITWYIIGKIRNHVDKW